MTTQPEKKENTFSGKRKKAVAKAWLVAGTGRVTINAIPIERYENELARLKMQEPLLVAGDVSKGYDIRVTVHGGGVIGQADACRQAIARCLVEAQPQLKTPFVQYDRYMLISDPRRTEPHKPPRSSQGPRRHKQRSKR